MVRDDLLFEEDLDPVRYRLEKPKGANAIWANTILNVGSQLSLDESRVESNHGHKGEDDADGSQGWPKRRPNLLEVFEHGWVLRLVLVGLSVS